MLTRRNWLLRFSIILNIVVLCYVGTHYVTFNNGVDFVDEVQTPGRNLASIEYNTDTPGQAASGGGAAVAAVAAVVAPRSEGTAPYAAESGDKDPAVDYVSNKSAELGTGEGVAGSGAAVGVAEVETVVMAIPPKHGARPPGPSTTQSLVNTSTVLSETLASPQADLSERTLEEVIKCHDRDQSPRTAQRGDFWVLYNYAPAARTFRCFESVTYTTHADYSFLDNLEPLLERWQGPVSLALHAPGADFAATLVAMQWLRDCGSPLVAELVTFHVYFGTKHVPKEVPKARDLFKTAANCSVPPPWTNVSSGQMYKAQKKLLYPVNIGRNIARESATTHYMLPSDIELYPSPGVIDSFLELVRRQEGPLLHKNPKVFPLSIFELESDAVIPNNKTQLVEMLGTGKAIPFHKKVCPGCHNVPRSKEWLEAKETQGLHIFHTGKRTGYFVHWEPIFIGTHDDPLYDERLSWEGKSDKMTQGYALCVLDYEFQILDNAFLVHKPGIKTVKKDTARAILAGKTNSLIKRVILPELRVLYGVKKGCAV